MISQKARPQKIVQHSTSLEILRSQFTQLTSTWSILQPPKIRHFIMSPPPKKKFVMHARNCFLRKACSTQESFLVSIIPPIELRLFFLQCIHMLSSLWAYLCSNYWSGNPQKCFKSQISTTISQLLHKNGKIKNLEHNVAKKLDDSSWNRRPHINFIRMVHLAMQLKMDICFCIH